MHPLRHGRPWQRRLQLKPAGNYRWRRLSRIDDRHRTGFRLVGFLKVIRAFFRSDREFRMEKEQNKMLEKMQKHLEKGFDNTKRIERPEEILERRQREREDKNRWGRRLGRWWRGEN